MGNNSVRQPVKISFFQLAAILTVSSVFTFTAVPQSGTTFLPTRFISLPLSVIFLIILYTPLIIFTVKNTESPLSCNNSVFKWIFGTIILLRLLYSAIFSVMQTHMFVTNTIMHYMPAIVFTAVVFLVVVYGSNKGVQATARMAPLSLAFFAFVITAVSVLTAGRVNTVRLYSPLAADGGGIISAAFTEAVNNDEIFFFALLCGFVREKNSEKNQKKTSKAQGYKSLIYYFPAVLLIGVWLTFLFNTILGLSLPYTPYPMHKIATFSSFNLIERMDGIFATSAVFAGLIKITVSFICVRVVISELLNSNKNRDNTENSGGSNVNNTERTAKIITSVLIAPALAAAYLAVRRERDINIGETAGLYLIASLAAGIFFMPVTALICKRKSNTSESNAKAKKEVKEKESDSA